MLYVKTDANGLITEAASGAGLPGFVEVDTDLSPARAAELFYFDSGGFMLLRPAIPPMDFDGTTLSITGCPTGTVVEVLDLASGLVIHTATADADNWADAMTFADAGLFRVTVTPPLPYREARLDLEVPE